MFKKISFLINVFILTFCGLALSLQGEIIETNEIKAFLPFINQDSFVFFNLSGTLYTHSNVLASRRWKEYFESQVREIIDDPEASEALIAQVKNQIVKIPKKNIEEITPRLIEYLQDRKIVVLGIAQKRIVTPYANHLGEIIHNHLSALGIQFERTLPYISEIKQPLELNDFTFSYGILFTNKKSTGAVMNSFVKQIGRQPSNIVVIDNSREALESVEKALELSGISFTGIRYGRVDEEEGEDFDPTIGTIEFLALINEGRILSDEEALKTMPIDKSVDYEAILQKCIQHSCFE